MANARLPNNVVFTDNRMVIDSTDKGTGLTVVNSSKNDSVLFAQKFSQNHFATESLKTGKMKILSNSL